MLLNSLQLRVAREIVALARRENMKAGEHLAESVLAERLGISRTPVNSALRQLSKRGIATRDVNRGYFLCHDAQDCLPLVEDLFEEPDEPLYLRIAEDRMAGRLPEAFSESGLMRRYGVARSSLRTVLARIQQEGWAERQLAGGWKFLALMDSPAVYEESYLFRIVVEPAGLMATTFQIRPNETARLQRRQAFIAEEGFKTMTSIELFEANSEFHETLAGWSGNRFILQSIRRINSLRRLIEYRQAIFHRPPRREAALEHLGILDALSHQNLLLAAGLLRKHLEHARRSKVHSASVFEHAPDAGAAPASAAAGKVHMKKRQKL